MNPNAFAIGLHSHPWARRKAGYICRACGVNLDLAPGKARETCPSANVAPSAASAHRAAQRVAKTR